MKSIENSFIIACSMYSKIPMPKVEWSKENMKYVMCFFPLIGLFIGGVIYGFYELQLYLSLTPVLSAIIFVLIPILVTGGIHMDGLMDTVDALSSYQTKERKLEILKDPHTGAFAVMACMCYLLLTFGVWYQISMKPLWILGLGFVLSRAMSGFAIVTFPLAKDTGLAYLFGSEADKKVTKIMMIIYIVLCVAGMILIDSVLGLIAIVSAGLFFIYYYKMSINKFGGITGDLAGYFLQGCELIMAVCVIIGEKL